LLFIRGQSGTLRYVAGRSVQQSVQQVCAINDYVFAIARSIACCISLLIWSSDEKALVRLSVAPVYVQFAFVKCTA